MNTEEKLKEEIRAWKRITIVYIIILLFALFNLFLTSNFLDKCNESFSELKCPEGFYVSEQNTYIEGVLVEKVFVCEKTYTRDNLK